MAGYAVDGETWRSTDATIGPATGPSGRPTGVGRPSGWARRQLLDRAARERGRSGTRWPPAPPGPRGRQPGPGRGARRLAHLLRARPGPHPALDGLPAPGRQDPGVRVPRRTTSAPGSPTPSRWPRSPPAIARACRLNVALTEAIALGHDCGHGPGGHASEDALEPLRRRRLRPRGLGRRRRRWRRSTSASRPSTASATTRGPGRRRPRPRARWSSWADRIAYVCHDLEDAVHAGLVDPDELPGAVTERCGVARSSQLRAWISDVVATTTATGLVGLSPPLAEALAVPPGSSTTSASTCGRIRSPGPSRDRHAPGPRRTLPGPPRATARGRRRCLTIPCRPRSPTSTA